jgi:RNA polymerase sigma-70 factor (ECF subfamily)
MSALTPVGADEQSLLEAARAGDERAFEAMVAGHLRAIHVHCYRMLGSYDDAEEATQETLLSAWRGLTTYEQRAPFRHWLYRIATTTCLKLRDRRERQPISLIDVTHVQPYPDRLLDELGISETDPAARAETRESVELAFITALQCLRPTPRAVLILRDVLAWSAVEVADLLDTSVAAVNSALQRARAGVRRATPNQVASRSAATHDHDIVNRFVSAWECRDIDALVALLAEDVVLRMPPEQIELYGHRTVASFFATVPAGGRLDRFHLLPTQANGCPAVAAYLPDDGGRHVPFGLMVLMLAGGSIVTITGFPNPELFATFGLPACL